MTMWRSKEGKCHAECPYQSHGEDKCRVLDRASRPGDPCWVSIIVEPLVAPTSRTGLPEGVLTEDEFHECLLGIEGGKTFYGIGGAIKKAEAHNRALHANRDFWRGCAEERQEVIASYAAELDQHYEVLVDVLKSHDAPEEHDPSCKMTLTLYRRIKELVGHRGKR